MEVLLATLLGTIIVVIALAVFGNVSRTRQISHYHSEMQAQGRYGMNRIREDVANFYRSRDEREMRLVGIKGSQDDVQRDRLLMTVVSDRPVHADRRESGIYEVEYGVVLDQETQGTFLGRRRAMVENGRAGNPGGMLTRLCENIGELTFAYYDGQEWVDQWHRSPALPKMVRVSMVLIDPQKLNPAITFSQVMALEPLPLPSKGNELDVPAIEAKRPGQPAPAD